MEGGGGAYPDVVELNVGGVFYSTTLSTLTREPDSLLGRVFRGVQPAPRRDAKGKYFLDRDGVLFRYVLDYLRNGALVLPDLFRERERLKEEAQHWSLSGMLEALDAQEKARPPGYITVGYRGSFGVGRDVSSEVKFRKLSRLLVCGRMGLCRAVFGDTLNDNRDPDHGDPERYTARFYLKHSSLEQAFDSLQEQGFRMVGSCGSGTAGGPPEKPGIDSEENRWNHYNEFVFVRD